MKILIKDLGAEKDITSNIGKIELQNYCSALIVRKDERERVLFDDGVESFELSEPETVIPIYLNASNEKRISVKSKSESHRYQLVYSGVSDIDQVDILNMLHFINSVNDVFKGDQQYSITDIIDAIEDGQVSLLVVKEPLTGYDDESLLRKIGETIPMIMDICSHPKNSLRTEEAVLDVNLVKRINSNTMKHLSSHSEHWKARTLNGLIPNRLRAEILEDDINIYENLFFRMTVLDIEKYIVAQVRALKATIKQNSNVIDWEKYGGKLNDYKRRTIFNQLLPKFDVSDKQFENELMDSLMQEWIKYEQQISTIEASQFFRSIDKKKHISRNIHPTNIIKKDSRYNALYRLWCDIQKDAMGDQISKGFSDELIEWSGAYYDMYVVFMLVYVLKLMGCTFDKGSYFVTNYADDIEIHAVAHGAGISYEIDTVKDEIGYKRICVTFVEDYHYDYQVTDNCLEFESFFDKLPDGVEYIAETGHIRFYTRPNEEAEKELKKLFKQDTGSKKTDKGYQQRLVKAELEWRKEMEQLFSGSKIREPKKEQIVLVPQMLVYENNNESVLKNTGKQINLAGDKTIVIVPIELDKYSGVDDSKAINRLLSFGEKYVEEDALAWGNYRRGLAPISQSDISSAQRMMKIISLFSAKMIMQWNEEMNQCPICGENDIEKIDSGTWRCRNYECGVLFGKTKCADGCGNYYDWTRPSIDIDEEDLQTESELERLLMKETIFDRLTITDFDFIPYSGTKMKYVPICPMCGKRHKNAV